MVPQTTKAGGNKKIDFIDNSDSTSTASSDARRQTSFKSSSQIDYLLNRDPMQEFFTLTCQSIKLNSPHMNTICTIDTMSLYKQVCQLTIPFFKWSSWVEDFLNKEFLRNALQNSKRTKKVIKIEEETKKQLITQAQYFQSELDSHNKTKNKKAISKTMIG